MPQGINSVQNFFDNPAKKNTCHDDVFLIKSRQDISTQKNASLVIFAL